MERWLQYFFDFHGHLLLRCLAVTAAEQCSLQLLHIRSLSSEVPFPLLLRTPFSTATWGIEVTATVAVTLENLSSPQPQVKRAPDP